MPNLQRPNTKISCGRLLHSDRLRLCFRKERRKSWTEMRAQLKEYDANRVRKWEPTWKNTMQIVEGKESPIERIRCKSWKEMKTQLKEYEANCGRNRAPNWKNTTQIVEGNESPTERIRRKSWKERRGQLKEYPNPGIWAWKRPGREMVCSQ